MMMLPAVLKSKPYALYIIFTACIYLLLLHFYYKNGFPDPSWTNLSPKFKVVPIKKACNNSCDVTNDFMCRPTTMSQWNSLITSPTVRFKPFLPDGEYMFSWEKEYLSFPPLVDSNTLPDLTLSTVTMASGNGKEIACDVGQRLTGRLDMKDGYGRPRHAGMDEVRVWLVDTEYNNRRAVGQVTDFRNGSYGLEITCLWPNSVAMLRVAVSYPREFLRSIIEQVNRGSTRYTVGFFKSKEGVEETTVCHPTPNLPGRDCLCNFTSFNSREYYCGRPLDKRLNCSHWTSTHRLNPTLPYKVTEAERKLIHQIPGRAEKRTLKIHMMIRTSAAGHLPKIAKCSNVSPSVTWDMTRRPQGFWDVKGAWRSLQCETSKFPGMLFRECLRGSTVYVIGDSNACRMYEYLVQRTMNNTTMHGVWRDGNQVTNKRWNITVKFLPHDYPLFTSDRWELLPTYGSVEKIIDAIPSSGRQVVLLHYFLHVVEFHLSVARSRVEAAAQALSRLLARNPDARVAFRGPHVSSYDLDINHSIGGDALGKQYLEIISQAFAKLKDRVVFLDGWEMTTALENSEFHPDNRVPLEMVLSFLSFVCK